MGDSEKRYDVWMRRNPSHTGRHIYHSWMEAVDGVSERVSVGSAVDRLGVSCAVLSRVLNGRASKSFWLALNLEAADWGTAEQWVRMQVNYDLVQ